MPGPPPSEQKRRRNVPTVPWTMLPAEGRQGRAPRLPARAPGGRVWLAGTRRWWADLWASPQAVMWERDGFGDGSMLFTLAALRDKFWRAETNASELRLTRAIEDDWGLTPRSMVALRWRLGEPVDPAVVAEARDVRAARQRRKAALGVIDGGGAP
jgi:hypothetical protein